MSKNPISLALFACAALFLVVSANMFYNQVRVYTLTLGTAAKGSVAYDFGRSLARVISERSARLDVEVVETEGTAQNARLLEQRRIDLAISQNDVAAEPSARLVALLYPEMFHLVVTDKSGIRAVSDLKGKRVGTPPVGSGSYNSFTLLLSHYGLDEQDVIVTPMDAAELNPVFLRGDLDAQFRNLSLGDDRVGEAIRGGQARLVPIDQGAAMRVAHPFVESFTIPKGAYRAVPPVPDADLPTVGVRLSLVARLDLEADVVYQITQDLFDFRYEMVADQPLAAYISSPEDAKSLTIAVHEGAQAYYDREKPSLVFKYIPVIGVGLSLLTLMITYLSHFRRHIETRNKTRADQHNREIVRLVAEANCATDPDEVDVLRQKLVDIYTAVYLEHQSGKIISESLPAFTTAWQMAISVVQHREAVLRGSGAPAASGGSKG